MNHMFGTTLSLFHVEMFHIHILFAGLIIMGGILFTHWALRTLSPTSLRTLALWLMVGGTALLLLTVPFCLFVPWMFQG